MNIFNSGKYGVAIPLTGLEVNINGLVYKDPICIARLLSIHELERYNNFDTQSPQSMMMIEEEIIENVFESFLGITERVDWGKIDAGVISTIVKSIIIKSQYMIIDIINTVENYKSSFNVIHSIAAIVSRFSATPYDQVENLPISEIIRRYSILQATFPEEIHPLQAPE